VQFTSISFLIFVVVVAIMRNAVLRPSYQKAVLGGASLYFIASYSTAWTQLLPLACFLAAGYGLAEALRRKMFKMFGMTVIFILAAFIYLKRYVFASWLPPLPFPYTVIGLSYILFRILHLMAEAHAGELAQRLDIRSYFNYTCNFLCFVSGPIQRYEDHLRAERNPSQLDRQKVYDGVSRAVRGYLKLAVISAAADSLFQNLSIRILSPDADVGGLAFSLDYALSVVSYTAYLYYNFSGYMDIVIGIGWLLGQEVPENFDKPFSSRSFLEFWTRWHMTLSEWFKIYLFNPLLQALAQRFTPPSAMVALGVIAFFITFLVMGIWHGTTLVFVVYGLLMGLGASLNKIWQVIMTTRFGKKGYKAIGDNQIYARLCRGLTFAYFSMAVTCLWVNMAQLQAILRHVGLGALLTMVVGLSLTFAAGTVVWDGGAVVLSRLRNSLAPIGYVCGARSLWLAVQILSIITVMSFFDKSLEFVYKAF
jgi:alginate O-acetyltransferase complex protein AlgI